MTTCYHAVNMKRFEVTAFLKGGGGGGVPGKFV